MLTPRPRHAQGFGGTYNAIGALGAVAAGIGLLTKGQIIGLVPLLILAPLFGRDAYLKYRAGNWP